METTRRRWSLRGRCIAFGVALGLLLVPIVTLAGKHDLVSDSVMTMRVDGDITIGIDGHVSDYRITTPVTPQIEKSLGAAVRGWTFKPVQFKGQPAMARSQMRVTLAAHQSHGGYAVSVDNVTFRIYPKDSTLAPGEVRADTAKPGENGVSVVAKSSLQAPKYPLGLMRAGVEGSVLLYLKVAPNGETEQIVAVQSSLFNVRGRPSLLEEARGMLEDSAIKAAKRWRFDVRADGKVPTAADLTVTVPVVYTMGHNAQPDRPGEWRVESRSAKAIVPWLINDPDVQDIHISDLDSGDVMPVASAFEVPKGVIGQAL